MTECDPSKCGVTEQFLEPAASLYDSLTLFLFAVAADMTECDPSKCEVTEQFNKSAAQSLEQEIKKNKLLVRKREDLDTLDEQATESQKLDEIADVKVKEKLHEEMAADMTECDASKCQEREQFLETGTRNTDQVIERDRLLVNEQEKRDIRDESVFDSEELDEIAFVAVKEEPLDDSPDNEIDDYTSNNESAWDSTEQDVYPQTPSTSVDSDMDCLNMVSIEMNNEIEESSSEMSGITGANNKTFKDSFTICSVCGYKASRPSHLKVHMMKHTGEKPFQCNECSYKCRTSKDLKTHKLTHTGEKPFPCSDCSHRSRTAGCLSRHKLIHTGEKRFPCPECSHKCRTTCDLKRHLLRHTGEKPFRCGKCSYNSSRQESLTRHMDIHR